MIKPAQLDLRVDRNVICRRTFAFLDFDFTAAIFGAAIKLTADAAGTAIITLTTQTTDVQGIRLVYAGSDTVQNHILAGRLSDMPPGLDLSTPVLLSQVMLRIDKATMENAALFPFPQERGDDTIYAWDFLITPAGGDQDKYAGGAFIVQGGVTT